MLGNTELRIFMHGKTEMRIFIGKTEMWRRGKVVAVVTDRDTVTFSSPPGEVCYKGGVRLASSVDAALIIIALAAID